MCVDKVKMKIILYEWQERKNTVHERNESGKMCKDNYFTDEELCFLLDVLMEQKLF